MVLVHLSSLKSHGLKQRQRQKQIGLQYSVPAIDAFGRTTCQYLCSLRASRTTSSTFGKKKCSSGGENGTGVSSPVMRTMGPSRSSKASSLMMAASSPASPPVL